MYTVAGEAAANAVNMSFVDLVETKIFKPLGLSHTGVSDKSMRKKERNYALGYAAESFEDAQKGRFKSLPAGSMAGASAPAGDLYSNVLDLVRWGNIIMRRGKSQEGQQLLNKESIKELLSAHSIVESKEQVTEFGPALTYGMGWLIDSYKGNPIYYHSGSVSGYISNLFFMPGQELVIAHLTNADVTILPHYLPFYVADELLNLPRTQDWFNVVTNSTKESYENNKKIAQGNLPERLKDKPYTRPLEGFVGVYNNPVYGDIIVELKTSSNNNNDRSKELFFKYQVYSGKLEHYHYDSFFSVLHYSSIRAGELFTFATSKDGSVKSIQMEELNEVFLRKE
ncbi:hypothetical protein BX616_008551 [Lobosporangium transversale]|nr:hypothetical protein BX616_008551 [Lobosporangium transversale]